MKSSNLRNCRATHRTKDWVNTRGELAGCGPAHLLPEAERQVGGSPSQQGAILAPEMAFATKLRAGSQLLTKPSWDPGQLTSTWRVAARDQRRHTAHLRRRSCCAPGNRATGTAEEIRSTAQLGRVCSPTTWSPELIWPGKGKNRRPSWVCAFVKYLRTWTWVA